MNGSDLDLHLLFTAIIVAPAVVWAFEFVSFEQAAIFYLAMISVLSYNAMFEASVN